MNGVLIKETEIGVRLLQYGPDAKLSGEYKDASEASAALASRYANDDTDTDVEGGAVGSRGARFEANRAAADRALAVAAADDVNLALLSQGSYPTIADGLANTFGTGTTGRFFAVPYDGVTPLRFFKNNAGVAEYYPRFLPIRAAVATSFIALPLPANYFGAATWLDGAPKNVYSDGVTWWDRDTSTAILDWWRPGGATLHVDFVNSRFYWNGAVRALADLTAVTGGYTLSGYDPGLAGSCTIATDYRIPVYATAATGTLFSSSGTPANGSGQRIELVPYNFGTRWYFPFTTANFWTNSLASKKNEGGSTDGRGIQRVISRFTSGAAAHSITNNSDLHVSTDANAAFVVGTLVPSVKLGFSVRGYDNAQPLANMDLRSVTIWPTALTDTQMDEYARRAPVKPVHLLGDSFLNLYKVLAETKVVADAGTRYVPVSQDGIGGTSLTQQATRYATARAKWRDATLVIVDGGLDYAAGEVATTEADKQALNSAALHKMLATITHDRWIYLGAAPNTDLGTGVRTDWDAMQNFMRSICGSHFVETLAPMQALSDGSADDIDFIARGLWPLSTRTSSDDFHPNTKGQAGLGSIIDAALRSRGWL